MTSKTLDALSRSSDEIVKLADNCLEEGMEALDRRQPEQSIVFLEKALSIISFLESTRGLDVKRSVLHFLGIAHTGVGNIRAARHSYEAGIRVSRQLVALNNYSENSLALLCRSLNDLGSLELSTGRLSIALAIHSEECEIREHIRTRFGDHFLRRRHSCMSMGDLGVVFDRLNQTGEARKLYFKALFLYSSDLEIRPDNTSTLDGIRVNLQRLGGLDATEDPKGALFSFEEALSIARELRSKTAESTCLVDLAGLYQKGGDTERALASRQEALQLVRLDIEERGTTSLGLIRLRSVLRHLGSAAAEALEWTVAIRHALEATELGLRPRQKSPISYVEDLRLLARICRAHPPARDQVWPLHEQMVSKVNSYTELNDPESTVRARPAINQFHAIWMGLALDTAVHRLTAVLGASQGRKVTALVMHQLQRQASSESAAPELHALLACRERVNHLSLASGGGSAGRSAFGDLADMTEPKRREESAEFTRARTEALWAEHRLALEAYEAARATLIATHPDFAELQPEADRFELARLQQGLADDVALLLLVQAPEDDYSSCTHRIHALLIRAKGDPLLRTLPQLDDLPAQLQTQPNRSALAYRDCQGSAWRSAPHQGEPERLDPVSVAMDVQQALREYLWAALQGGEGQADLLAGLRHLHVVSHGDLHGLPLALGAPEGLEVSLYPGLVYYWLQRQRGALAWPATCQLRYQFYSPQEDLSGGASTEALKPIPHVHTEAALVGSCWAERDELLRPSTSDTVAATVLHLGCHGSLEREGQEDPCLILAEDHRHNLIELLQGAPSAPIVYLSACMVGRTREDLDGDPLGLVGGFMLRGARCVIAALNPISDFYAPLLAYLFHLSLQAQAETGQPLDAVAALADAKKQLRSGDWTHPAQQAVIDAYAPRLQQQLERAIWDDASNALLPVGSWTTQLMGWLGSLIPAIGADTFTVALELSELLETKLSAAEVAAGRMLAEKLVAARASLYFSTPAVQHLLMDMQAFG